MNDESVTTNALSLGGAFEFKGRQFEVDEYVDLESLIAREVIGGRRERLSISEILQHITESTANDAEAASSSGVVEMPKEDWKEAERRGDELKALFDLAKPSKKAAEAVAASLGKEVSTIYRWLRKFKKDGLAALAPHHPTGGRGKARVDGLVDEIIETVINDEFMTTLRPKVSQIMPTIESRCRRAKVSPPHPNTVRNRIRQISAKRLASARDGKKGREKYTPRPGTFPGADYPNAVWQVDHTPLDVCIVDDEYRLNIGRPWLTLVMDVYSRCVVGFYLSLEKPNATSVGMALVHSILPKDGWLAAHGISAKWPIWGKPVTVHADNDKTFRCEMVTRAAKAQQYKLEWRAVATPNWGGHIERLLGTVNQEIHTIPGTTFSNPAERGEYEPHNKAEFTFAELETHLTKYLCGIYHVKRHSGIGRPPLRRYESGLFGDGLSPGCGLPAPIKDPERLRLDFLPFKTITVQKNGITWDVITYYDQVLDRWIKSADPANPKKRRKFICRRDPRDLSLIWFLDPDRNQYYKIPLRKSEHPGLNLWELREVRAHLRKAGADEVDEETIFRTFDEMHAGRQAASLKTKAARKAAQQKVVHAKKAKAEKAQVDVAAGKRAASEVDREAEATLASTALLRPMSEIAVHRVRSRQ